MIDLVIGFFVTWRIAALLTNPNETAPFDLLAKFRDAIGITYDEHSHPHGRNEVARALTCLACTSIWVGLAVSALQGHTMVEGTLLGLAYSGAATILEELRVK